MATRKIAKVGVAVFVKHHDTAHYILTTKRKKGVSGGWSLPGGVILFGETVKDAVYRTVKEETGVDLMYTGKMTMGPLSYTYGNEHHIILFYMARTRREYALKKTVYKLKWFEKKEFNGLTLMNPLPEFLDEVRTSQELQ